MIEREIIKYLSVFLFTSSTPGFVYSVNKITSENLTNVNSIKGQEYIYGECRFKLKRDQDYEYVNNYYKIDQKNKKNRVYSLWKSVNDSKEIQNKCRDSKNQDVYLDWDDFEKRWKLKKEG